MELVVDIIHRACFVHQAADAFFLPASHGCAEPIDVAIPIQFKVNYDNETRLFDADANAYFEFEKRPF